MFFFLLNVYNVVGQANEENFSTIIFNDGTKIKGYGEIKKNKILFKLTEKEEFTEWSHDSVKGITFSGYGFAEKYEYVIPDKYTEPKIMEVLETGKVSLYRRWKNNVNMIMIISENQNPLNFINNAINLNSNTDSFSEAPIHKDSFSKEPIHYVKKENEQYATDINFSFKTRVLKYFADCEIIIKKIKNRTFKIDNIPELISYYNNFCYEEEN